MPVQAQPEPTLRDLQTTMNSFMEMMDSRMSRLEGAMYYVQQMVEQSAPMAQELQTVIRHVITHKGDVPNDAVMAIQGAPVSDSGVRLVFEGMETKWFTERLFPEFKIRAIQNGALYDKADGWKVTLRLMDGNKNFIDDRMGDVQNRVVILRNGEATVSGIKFSAVSSKNGNFFNIQAKVVAPDMSASSVPEALSENLVILSCRLFHNPKRQIDELTPDDQLSKMPGIGRLYAERFASYSITTIRQLASVPLGQVGRRQRLDLLNHLRRDKGTMTEPKLSEYIETALEIVKREEVQELEQFSSLAAGQPPAKKLRTDSPEFTAPANLPTSVDQYFDFQQTLPSATAGMPPIPDLLAPTPPSLAAPNPTELLDFPSADLVRSGDGGVAVSSPPVTTPVPVPSPEVVRRGRVRPSVQYPLHNAIATGDLMFVRNVVKAMREGGLPLSEENEKGWTPLMFACATHQIAITEFLCSLPEVDVAQQSTVSGATALHIAACKGDARVVQTLLRSPACDTGAVNNKRFTPLMLAVLRGNTEVVRLLAKIADSYRPKTVPGCGLYHLAALSGSLPIMQLIHDGCRTYSLASPALNSPYGSLVWSPKEDRPEVPSILHCAAYSGNTEVIEWLFSQGVSGEITNAEGWTALHFAAYCGHPQAIAVLARHTPVNAKTTNGWTALSLAMMSKRGMGRDTVSALLAVGADDSGVVPPNLVAVSTNNLQALEALDACLTTPQIVKDVGQVTPMELGQFFDTTSQLEPIQQRIAIHHGHAPPQ